jgi:hypothetical protein
MGKNKRNSGCQVHSLAPPLATEVASLIKLKTVQFSSVNLEPLAQTWLSFPVA